MFVSRVLLVVLLVSVCVGAAVTAPAPLPKPAPRLTAEQITAELRQRGYHVHELKRTDVPGYWEITVRLDTGGSGTTTEVFEGGGTEREALLAYQARTLAQARIPHPYRGWGYKGPRFAK